MILKDYDTDYNLLPTSEREIGNLKLKYEVQVEILRIVYRQTWFFYFINIH